MSEWDEHALFIDSAETYDDIVELVQPSYEQLHQVMRTLAVYTARSLGNQADRPVAALDIGSGTGKGAIALLGESPGTRVLGVDYSEAMHRIFQTKAKTAGVTDNRYRLLNADINDVTAKAAIQDSADAAFGSGNFQIILSSLTFHAFSDEQRIAALRLVFELLEPGGVFLLGDLFNFDGESPWLSQTVAQWEIDRIDFNFEQTARKATEAGLAREAADLKRLKEKWVHHYKEHDLASVTAHLNMLKEVGFREAGNPFRSWQAGVIVAKKE